jgi:hypothetical protein
VGDPHFGGSVDATGFAVQPTNQLLASPGVQGSDFRITTGATDWANTSSLITPNFGDYTDNASAGTTTYYTWSDGRLGVPQPFADRR